MLLLIGQSDSLFPAAVVLLLSLFSSFKFIHSDIDFFHVDICILLQYVKSKIIGKLKQIAKSKNKQA